MSLFALTQPGNSDFAPREGPNIMSPKDLLELPRASPGLVNDVGDLVVVSVATYSFEDEKFHRVLTFVPIDGTAQPLEIPLEKPGEVFWLDSRTIGQVTFGEDGKQGLFSTRINFSSQDDFSTLSLSYSSKLVGQFPTSTSSPAGNFVYSAAAQVLVFSAEVYDDFDLFSVDERDKAHARRGNSALVYDSTFVRHWDTWRGPKTSALFVVALAPSANGDWKLGDKFVCPLKGTKHVTPVAPFGGTDDFSVSATHLVYASRDPALAPAFHTRRNIYIVPLDGSSTPRQLTSGEQGETHSPVFSHNGSKVAWLEMAEDGNDADRLRILYYDLATETRCTLAPGWDRSPDSVLFSHDDSELLLTAADYARVKVFTVSISESLANLSSSSEPTVQIQPVALTATGTASNLQPLKDGRLVFSKHSLTSPIDIYTLAPLSPTSKLGRNQVVERRLTNFANKYLKGKDLVEPEEVWFEGAKRRKVHGWVIKPPEFRKGAHKAHPAIMLIHGGPQAAFHDQWSFRFNPQAWAQQGYIVFVPNFTGSTGFGQEFVDAVAGDWGGAPFVDMRAGWAHVCSLYPEIDEDRAGAAGGSWGGYAVNFIQGHPEFGFNFKALICHDGEFDSTYSGYSVDEQFIFSHEWGGRPWEEKPKAKIEKMSPHNFVENWSTPQLLLHGSCDYRVSETQAIAAFHALQQRGVPSRLVVFPDENHFVSRPGNSLKWHHEVFHWLNKYTGKLAK